MIACTIYVVIADAGLYDVAVRPFVEFGSGWLSLEGDHIVPIRSENISNISKTTFQY